MKTFRTILFWGHLTAGLTAGLVIFVMSITGVALSLKPQILNLIEREVRFVTPQDTPRLGPHELLTIAAQAHTDSPPVSLALDRDPRAAAAVNMGPTGNLYVNPYTGAVLGAGSARANQFFQSMTTWHRYMGASGESRPLGKSATGAANLAFLVLAISGLYMWWPKQLTIQRLRPIAWFRGNATGRARDFNWHNVIGFWCLPAIVIMTVSGAVISYPWASNLVYRLTGSPVPAARAVVPAPAPASTATAVPTVIPASFDHIWARAEQQVPAWSLITARLGSRTDAPVTFTITDGEQWNRFARSTLTLKADGEVAQWQPYEGGSLGQKARGWLRYAHTGELGGLAGQIIAGLGCLGGVFLICTGVSLAFRRLWNWSLWARLRGAGRYVPEPQAPAVLSADAEV